MAWRYTFHSEAQIDYESSVSWYLKRSLKAATNFVNAIDKALDSICKDPERNYNGYKNYFEHQIEKYPFTIVYVIEPTLHRVIIISVYHQKRSPSGKYRESRIY